MVSMGSQDDVFRTSAPDKYYTSKMTKMMIMETVAQIKGTAKSASYPKVPSAKPPPYYSSFFQALDGHKFEPPEFDSEHVYFICGAIRMGINLPLELGCSFCTYILMTLRRIGISVSIILCEIGKDRPKWLQERAGCEKPDVPLIFYRGKVYGTKTTQEIVDELPRLFPVECRTTGIMCISPHLPGGLNFVDSLLKTLWLRTVDLLKSTSYEALSNPLAAIFEPVESALQKSQYLSGGDFISYADCKTAIQVQNALMMECIIQWKKTKPAGSEAGVK